MEIQFQKACDRDLDKVFEVFLSAIDEMKRHNILQWDEVYPDRKIIYEDIKNGQLYMGVSDGEVASVYVVNQECDKQYELANWNYPDLPYCVIHRLCVNPKFQKRGIGALTVGHIENEVKKEGGMAIRLDAFVENPYAVRLYEKLNYLKVGYAQFRKGSFYLMEKRL